jgi:hypothetical protein
MFSLPSTETQFPGSCSCTLRVGLDVIGTWYSHAPKGQEAQTNDNANNQASKNQIR